MRGSGGDRPVPGEEVLGRAWGEGGGRLAGGARLGWGAVTWARRGALLIVRAQGRAGVASRSASKRRMRTNRWQMVEAPATVCEAEKFCSAARTIPLKSMHGLVQKVWSSAATCASRITLGRLSVKP